MGDAGGSPATSSTAPPPHHQQRPVRAGLPSANPTPSFWQTSFPNPLVHHRSTPNLPASVDVAVVGTGISGTFAVDELLSHVQGVDVAVTDLNDDNDDNSNSLTVLALEARTLCSAATGRNGGHLQPIVHGAPAHIIDFELRNFHHVEALALNTSRKAGDDGITVDEDDQSECHGDYHDEIETESSIPPSAPNWCDFRRLEGCLGFWNEEFFRDAKRDFALAASTSTDNTGAGTGIGSDKTTNTRSASEDDKPTRLARVVEDPAELETLGLKIDSGAVGAIVQSVAASLSPYKLCVGLWSGLLERFEQGRDQGQNAKPEVGRDGRGTGGRVTEARVSKRTLNLQTDTPVTALERVYGDDNDNDNATHGWILHTPRGNVHARTVILATNAYTSHLLPDFAPLIRPVQAQMSALIPPPPPPSLSPARGEHHKISGDGTANGNPNATDEAENCDKNSDAPRPLIPMSYGFVGVGDMDRVMSDYLVQNPYHHHHHHHNDRHGDSDSGRDRQGGHLMFGGGRHLALHHGEGVWDDDFVDKRVERYLRGLSERLHLNQPSLNSKAKSNDRTHQDRTRVATDDGTGTESSLSPSSSPSHTHSTDDDLLPLAASWTGIIGHSSDGHPWIGPAPDHPGVFVCAGYTGHGMTNAPLCGRDVARRAVRALRVWRAGDTGRDGNGDRDIGRDIDVDVHLDEDGNAECNVPPEYLITRDRIERVKHGSAGIYQLSI
ncbi:hypothetical protein Z517_06544 [Fonsecaea pedrosoi CBS 271.37]|uniref:Unplaced genomic scaffold supercont1.4, whole genome shotgun sequence n=1 Tax=Fonsecaea pedrosoi CBS 271.37 TaxID=1442368 RepID=A0A0D2H5M3_9EURO|nr:uncharacterized protein Z517_06544 [Fonsecaea pedrosoi CBS 271.37]KIW79929.1 hypothetical protein Z517_06544 [Fonsecaea pedrosoi CBS 271.37]